ncbi:MAG: glycosyltransferase family 2 protein, partial [Proteobacteria bacterium]|nr:glycosyltransferase family 2 protein [Pseudomonadota bacterium]
MAPRTTLCLSMIVKDEAGVIRRCLDSVRPLIDHWVVVDTGSTDGTQALVRAALADLPGELHERPWRDFAHNRSEALEFARPHADYSLMIDADDVLEVPPGYRLPRLTADAYYLEIEHPPARYERLQIVRNALPWRYRGVLHEFLACEGAGKPGRLPIRYRMHFDGARRRDPATFARDAAVLEAALATETDPLLRARYTFYLAQSYRDGGQRERALELYRARAALGGWREEVYVSLLEAARLAEALARPETEVLEAYLEAARAGPHRAEALHGAARYCREKQRWAEGLRHARAGLRIAMPRQALFVEPWIYEWGLLDEFAIHAYWTGHYRESL